MKDKQVTAIGYAGAAAMFYALNVPCSKLLLDKIAPTLMAAFLYPWCRHWRRSDVFISL